MHPDERPGPRYDGDTFVTATRRRSGVGNELPVRDLRQGKREPQPERKGQSDTSMP